MRRIKNITLVVALMLSSALMVSCGSKDKPSEEAIEKLGKMEVVIPDELKDNPEIVEYVEGMSEVADAYALLIDESLTKLGDYAGKEWEELNMREQIKVTATAAEIAMKAAPNLAKLAEYQAKYYELGDSLTDDEILALATVWERFEARLEQIEEKNAKFFAVGGSSEEAEN